jgi:hypothetical protein
MNYTQPPHPQRSIQDLINHTRSGPPKFHLNPAYQVPSDLPTPGGLPFHQNDSSPPNSPQQRTPGKPKYPNYPKNNNMGNVQPNNLLNQFFHMGEMPMNQVGFFNYAEFWLMLTSFSSERHSKIGCCNAALQVRGSNNTQYDVFDTWFCSSMYGTIRSPDHRADPPTSTYTLFSQSPWLTKQDSNGPFQIRASN